MSHILIYIVVDCSCYANVNFYHWLSILCIFIINL